MWHGDRQYVVHCIEIDYHRIQLALALMEALWIRLNVLFVWRMQPARCLWRLSCELAGAPSYPYSLYIWCFVVFHGWRWGEGNEIPRAISTLLPAPLALDPALSPLSGFPTPIILCHCLVATFVINMKSCSTDVPFWVNSRCCSVVPR